jgi:peptide/nickel transport system permease protein
MRFLVRRLAQSVAVLLILTVIAFGIVRLSGDPVLLLIPLDSTSAEIDAARVRLGFDQPLPVQYLRFLERAAQGDFGVSLRYRQSALGLVVERLPATLELAGGALLVSILVSFPLGIISATRRGSVYDYLSAVLALVGQIIPVFFLGLLAILLFAVQLHWLPTSGRGGLEKLILPATTLGIVMSARLTRLVRAGMIDVLAQDYVTTARGKGLRPRDVVLRHALRNALLPLVTVIGLEIAQLLGGAVVIETVYAWPGLGLLAVTAMLNRDYPIVLADVVFVGSLFILLNLIVDLAYRVIDPRIRYA